MRKVRMISRTRIFLPFPFAMIGWPRCQIQDTQQGYLEPTQCVIRSLDVGSKTHDECVKINLEVISKQYLILGQDCLVITCDLLKSILTLYRKLILKLVTNSKMINQILKNYDMLSFVPSTKGDNSCEYANVHK